MLRRTCQPGYHSELGGADTHAGRNLFQVTRANSCRGLLHRRTLSRVRQISLALHTMGLVRHAVRTHVCTLRELDPVTQSAGERESAYFTEINWERCRGEPLWNGAMLL